MAFFRPPSVIDVENAFGKLIAITGYGGNGEESGLRFFAWTGDQLRLLQHSACHGLRLLVSKDLDGDGALELYVAADDQRELKKYVWDAESGTFKKTLLGRLEDNTISWNITTGMF